MSGEELEWPKCRPIPHKYIKSVAVSLLGMNDELQELQLDLELEMLRARIVSQVDRLEKDTARAEDASEIPWTDEQP